MSATIPLITPTDIVNHYDMLVRRSGVKTLALVDIAQAASARIARQVGYVPELDTVSNLPVVTEKLDGGRPVVYLLAVPDLVTVGASFTLKEFGVTLVQRPTYPLPTDTGDYFIDSYAVYRLNGQGARTLGVWGANSNANIPAGTFGNMTVGGVRQEGDYTNNYRQVIEVTYNPQIQLALFKTVALKLARLELLDRMALSAVSVGDKSYTYAQLAQAQTDVEDLLSALPVPIRVGTGN